MILKGKKISIYYETYGNKKNTIVILPGWGDTRKTFQFFIDSLKEDYKIYILDYPGFGNSITPKNTLTLEDYVELIQEWFQKENIKNPIIIAHSFGGRISSLLISKYKIKVKKLLLIDVAGIKRRKKLKIFLKEKIYKLLKHLIKLLPKNIQKKQLIKLSNYFSSKDYKQLPNSMKKTFQNIIEKDLKKEYQEIDCETLILWGEKDEDTPLKDGYLLNKIIKNSEIIIYKNANHYSYLYDPYRTLRIIQIFIKEK